MWSLLDTKIYTTIRDCQFVAWTMREPASVRNPYVYRPTYTCTGWCLILLHKTRPLPLHCSLVCLFPRPLAPTITWPHIPADTLSSYLKRQYLLYYTNSLPISETESQRGGWRSDEAGSVWRRLMNLSWSPRLQGRAEWRRLVLKPWKLRWGFGGYRARREHTCFSITARQ